GNLVKIAAVIDRTTDTISQVIVLNAGTASSLAGKFFSVVLNVVAHLRFAIDGPHLSNRGSTCIRHSGAGTASCLKERFCLYTSDQNWVHGNLGALQRIRHFLHLGSVVAHTNKTILVRPGIPL